MAKDKDLSWFKFSPLNWMTGRIRKEPEGIQLAFIELTCLYWKNRCEMTIDQAELEIGDKLQPMIDRKIVKIVGQNIEISFLDDQIESIAETSKGRKIAAKSRWDKAKALQNDASVMQINASALQSDADREIERKTEREKDLVHKSFSDDFYESPAQAFEEIKNNELQMENLLMIVHRNGYRACNMIILTHAIRNFITIEAAKPDFLNRPRDAIKEHLVNWINKNAKDLQKYAA